MSCKQDWLPFEICYTTTIRCLAFFWFFWFICTNFQPKDKHEEIVFSSTLEKSMGSSIHFLLSVRKATDLFKEENVQV